MTERKRNMEKKLVVIDGHSLAIRAYFAMELKVEEGSQLFKKWLEKIGDQFNPTHTVAAWDTLGGSTYKKEIYPDYKAHRDDTHTQDIVKHIDVCQEIAKKLGFTNVTQDGLEADDLIGHLSTFDIPTVIVSSDKDLIQLVSPSTTLYRPKVGVDNMEVWDLDAYQREFGFGTDGIHYAHYKALTGDSSDNYKGVVGIGPKTALKLIQEYQTIDNIYNHIDEIKGATQKKLIDGKEAAYLGLELALINTEGVAPLDLDSFKQNKT